MGGVEGTSTGTIHHRYRCHRTLTTHSGASSLESRSCSCVRTTGIWSEGPSEPVEGLDAMTRPIPTYEYFTPFVRAFLRLRRS